jgi:hypothetical protein
MTVPVMIATVRSSVMHTQIVTGGVASQCNATSRGYCYDRPKIGICKSVRG